MVPMEVGLATNQLTYDSEFPVISKDKVVKS